MGGNCFKKRHYSRSCSVEKNEDLSDTEIEEEEYNDDFPLDNNNFMKNIAPGGDFFKKSGVLPRDANKRSRADSSAGLRPSAKLGGGTRLVSSFCQEDSLENCKILKEETMKLFSEIAGSNGTPKAGLQAKKRNKKIIKLEGLPLNLLQAKLISRPPNFNERTNPPTDPPPLQKFRLPHPAKHKPSVMYIRKLNKPKPDFFHKLSVEINAELVKSKGFLNEIRPVCENIRGLLQNTAQNAFSGIFLYSYFYSCCLSLLTIK